MKRRCKCFNFLIFTVSFASWGLVYFCCQASSYEVFLQQDVSGSLQIVAGSSNYIIDYK